MSGTDTALATVLAEAREYARAAQDRREIKVHFAGIFGFEWRRLQVDNDKAAQLQVVKEQVDPEVFASDFERIMASNERESDTKFQQELPDMFKQAGLSNTIHQDQNQKHADECDCAPKNRAGRLFIPPG